MTRPDLSHMMRIDVSGGIVRVWHSRSAVDVVEAAAVIAEIDDALASSGIERLLFDSREADRTKPEVAAAIWAWLSSTTRVRRVATVMNSEVLSANVRSTGVGMGVLIKAFATVEEAERWLFAL